MTRPGSPLAGEVTNLPNRLLLMDRIEHQLSTIPRLKRPIALLFLDIDNFKLVNDTLGHAAGDSVLIEIARRILSSIAERPVSTDQQITVTASIGIATGDNTASAVEVLRRADCAMYQAKRDGRNQLAIFDVKPGPGLNIRAATMGCDI